MSGVKVNDACIKKWEELKAQKIKACNFKLSDNMKEIIVDEGSEIPKDTPGAWKQWCSTLPEKVEGVKIQDITRKAFK